MFLDIYHDIINESEDNVNDFLVFQRLPLL